MELLVPIVAFFASCLLIALLAWWSGAWRSLLSGVDDDIDPSHDPELLLRSAEHKWIEDHDFWKLTEVEEISL